MVTAQVAQSKEDQQRAVEIAVVAAAATATAAALATRNLKSTPNPGLVRCSDLNDSKQIHNDCFTAVLKR